MKKSYSIDFKYDYDFILIGICSPIKDYHICYKLNKTLNISLYRSKHDVYMDFYEGIEKGQFSLYEYYDEQYENQWYLITNKCQILCQEEIQNKGTIFDGFLQNEKKTKYLIPEDSTVDFYLQVHGVYCQKAKSQLIKNIKKINTVVNAYEIIIQDLASKENLIIK